MSEQNWDYLKSRITFFSRNDILELAVRLSFKMHGNIVEFGVAKGHSTRMIYNSALSCEKFYPRNMKKCIYAFDSFKGLTERFENLDLGAFATTPPVISGVNIVEGFFDDTLTVELAQKIGKVAFASLDADLYSSTLCALRWLTPLLSSGSLLLFDEFLGEKESEKRAFEEWSIETGIKTIMIAEFVREPSGWGSKMDKRILFQVISEEKGN